MADFTAFSNTAFLFRFLPLFLIVYYVLPVRYKNAAALFGSILFYALGEPLFVFLLLALIGVNYLFARAVMKVPRANYSGYREKSRKRMMILAVTLDVGVLAVFKILSSFGDRIFVNSGLTFVMPLGLSFYIFKMISFQIDLYRDDIYAKPSLWDVALYFSLFPQIAQGPIMRYDEGDFHREKHPKLVCIEEGLKYFIPGLAMKVLLADRIGILWNDLKMYGYESISPGLAWLGAFAYSFQLYFDFYGYSLMASGILVMMGYEFIENFDEPYSSVTVSEFYRRWHMTLGHFFRDYVYFPMGGSRVDKGRIVLNLGVVWLLTGIWHGNGLNFMIWGIILGIFIILEKLFYGKALSERFRILGHFYVLLIIPLTWVVFALTDLKMLGVYFTRLFPFRGNGPYVDHADILGYLKDYGFLFVCAILLCIPATRELYRKYKKSAPVLLLLALLFFASVYFMASGANNPFMYLRF